MNNKKVYEILADALRMVYPEVSEILWDMESNGEFKGDLVELDEVWYWRPDPLAQWEKIVSIGIASVSLETTELKGWNDIETYITKHLPKIWEVLSDVDKRVLKYFEGDTFNTVEGIVEESGLSEWQVGHSIKGLSSLRLIAPEKEEEDPFWQATWKGEMLLDMFCGSDDQSPVGVV